jgi:hypothetical protein
VGDFEDAIMNCKPGDLAVIISTLRSPENIGRIVEVIRTAVPGEEFVTAGRMRVFVPTQNSGPIWRVRGQRPLIWRDQDGKVEMAFEVPCADSYLRPITGVPVNDEVTDDIKEPA